MYVRWVNNCVGIGNHKLFILFVLWIFVVCTYSLVLIAGKYISCMSGDEYCGDSGHHLLVLFLVIESLLFGLFTLCMIGDQATTVLTNQTQIDRLKHFKHAIEVDVNEVFGSAVTQSFHWSWLTPIAVRFDGVVRNAILGYRVEACDEESDPLMMTMMPTMNTTTHTTSALPQRQDEDEDDEAQVQASEWLNNANTIPAAEVPPRHHVEVSRSSYLKQQLDAMAAAVAEEGLDQQEKLSDASTEAKPSSFSTAEVGVSMQLQNNTSNANIRKRT
jgi:hypothetical protein